MDEESAIHTDTLENNEKKVLREQQNRLAHNGSEDEAGKPMKDVDSGSGGNPTVCGLSFRLFSVLSFGAILVLILVVVLVVPSSRSAVGLSGNASASSVGPPVESSLSPSPTSSPSQPPTTASTLRTTQNLATAPSATPTIESPSTAPVDSQTPAPTPSPTTKQPTSSPVNNPTVASSPSPTPTTSQTVDPTDVSTTNPSAAPSIGDQRQPLEVGLTACVIGFVMDYFCIERGTLLDNFRVKTLDGPDQHSIHCLVDPGVCRNSEYEVLFDPIDTNSSYTRGFRLNENAKAQAIALARAVGTRCSTCDGTGSQQFGFRAAFHATVVDLGDGINTPPTIDAINVVVATAPANPCADLGLANIMDISDVSGIPGDD